MMINRGNNAKSYLKASSLQISQPAPGPYFDVNGWTGDMVLLTSAQFPVSVHPRTTTTEVYPND